MACARPAANVVVNSPFSCVKHGSPILPHVWVHRIQAARFKLHPWQTLLALCYQGIDELCRR